MRQWVGVIFCLLLGQGSIAWGIETFSGFEHSERDRYENLFNPSPVSDIRRPCFIEPEGRLESTILLNAVEVKMLPMAPGSASLLLCAVGTFGVWRIKGKRIHLNRPLREYLDRRLRSHSGATPFLYRIILYVLWCLYAQLLALCCLKRSWAFRVKVMGDQIFSLESCRPRSPPGDPLFSRDSDRLSLRGHGRTIPQE